MSARGTAFLQLWLERNVLTLALDRDQAPRLASKLVSDAAEEGLEPRGPLAHHLLRKYLLSQNSQAEELRTYDAAERPIVVTRCVA